MKLQEGGITPKRPTTSQTCAVGPTKPDLDVPMYHHDQTTLSVSTQQPLGAMRTNFTQVGPMGHISIQYNKDMIMDTDTDTLTYLWRIFLKILMKSEVTFFRKSQC